MIWESKFEEQLGVKETRLAHNMLFLGVVVVVQDSLSSNLCVTEKHKVFLFVFEKLVCVRGQQCNAKI